MTSLNPFRARDESIVITGGGGMLGRALIAELAANDFGQVLAPTRSELDLLDAVSVADYFQRHKPRWVFHLASVVYGLQGNMQNQLSALADNTAINHNVLTACGAVGVRKVFFAGTVASYPFPYAQLPLTEEMLWNGKPHCAEFGYACAKRHALAYLEILDQVAGMEFCYGVLTNLYGPHDRFDDQNGHVVPSLVRRLHRAARNREDFHVWGDGEAERDFMYVADTARAVLLCMDKVTGVVNLCSGITIRIAELVDELIAAARFSGRVVWDSAKPVGIPKRSVSDRILRELGFHCDYDLKHGLAATWKWYADNADTARSSRVA